jgi:serine/threonine protein kinase
MKPDAHTPLQNGRYRLLEQIGEGGMATVYRAMDTTLGVQRAIKLLAPRLLESTSARARFRREAHAMARVHHPHVATIFDVGADDTLFLVMELLRGGTLQDWSDANGPMPARMAVRVMLQVLEGLAAAHKEGITHRDTKPANILFTADGRTKVVDFGIAHMDDGAALTGDNTRMGSWFFMAPEQRESASKVDARADLFSVAATLYQTITNERPLHIYHGVERDALLERVPECLRPIFVKATQIDPSDRYTSAQAMAADLEAVLEDLPGVPLDTPQLGNPDTTQIGEEPPPVAADAGETTFDVDDESPASQTPTARFRPQEAVARLSVLDAKSEDDSFTESVAPKPQSSRLPLFAMLFVALSMLAVVLAAVVVICFVVVVLFLPL